MTRISCTETGPEHGNFRGAAPAASGNKGACGGHDNTTLVSQQGKGQWRLIALELVPTAAQRLPAQVSAANRKSNGNKVATTKPQTAQEAWIRSNSAHSGACGELLISKCASWHGIAAEKQRSDRATRIYFLHGNRPRARQFSWSLERRLRRAGNKGTCGEWLIRPTCPLKTGLKSRLLQS